MNFVARIDASLAATPASHPFIRVDEATLSYGALLGRLERLFTLFRDVGLGPSSRIGILVADPTDTAVLALAGMRAGLGVTVINPEFTAPEIARVCRACAVDRLFRESTLTGPDGAVAETVFAPAADRGRGLMGRLRRKSADAIPTLADLVASLEPSSPPPQVADDAILVMLSTSGTTSVPKVVELSHANVSAQLDAFAEVYDYGRDSRILNPLPMHFTDGLFHGPIAAAVNGASLHRPKRFEFTQLEGLINGVYRDAITHFIVVPAILSLMDRLGREFTDSFEGAEFRYIRSSGDRLPTELWRSIEDRFGVRVVNTYGMSETVCEALYCGPDDALRKVGTVGKAVGCEWRILDEDGAELPTGEVGELAIRGPIITPGYRDQPELTAAAIPDGWLRTGDLAVADADGFVTIVGRKKDLIISGGVNIQPQEITDCLLAHEDVADAFAFGLPHAVWGEQVAAAVVPRPGAELDRMALTQHCQAALAQHKVPRVVEFMAELPRTSSGKVVVADLRAAFEAADTSAGSAAEGTVAQRVVAEAARVFGVPADRLHLTAEPGTTGGWDSFAHLALVTAIEERFKVKLSAREVLRIDRLSDLVDILVAKGC